jgi:hypothetical protein
MAKLDSVDDEPVKVVSALLGTCVIIFVQFLTMPHVEPSADSLMYCLAVAMPFLCYSWTDVRSNHRSHTPRISGGVFSIGVVAGLAAIEKGFERITRDRDWPAAIFVACSFIVAGLYFYNNSDIAKIEQSNQTKRIRK